MQTSQHFPVIEGRTPASWSYILLQSVAAIGSAFVVTGIIYFLHLYPLIPNISMLYLLVVLGLASTFGMYSAVVAAITAFLCFDYFLVPPLYVFTIDRWEEWVALFIFLLTALLTSQLTEALRRRTAQAQRREREAQALYELIRLTNSQEQLDEQLKVITEAFVTVFASWGVQDCALLTPDTSGDVVVAAGASLHNETFEMSSEEHALALSALTQRRIVEKRIPPRPDAQDTTHHISRYSEVGAVTIVRFIPLKTAEQSFGLLYLSIQHPVSWFASLTDMQQEPTRPNARINFFWTFLEQATSLLERTRLRATVHVSHP